jgi:hypothetical protein
MFDGVHRVGQRIAALLLLQPTSLVFLLAALVVGCSKPGPADPPCDLEPGDPRAEPVETRCDGLDNDCDLLRDVLLPVDANRCQTGKPGACGQGYAACSAGTRICIAPPPVAETVDGVDNDCNGQVDDVAPTSIRRCRARVLVPPYIWQESPEIPSRISFTLEQVGIPYDIDQKGSDWTTGFSQLADYALVIIPGYLIQGALDAPQREALRHFVEGGGVVVWDKVLGAVGEQPLFELAGVAGAEKRLDVTDIHLDAVPATLYLDSLEERELKLTDPGKTSDQVFVYTANAAAGAVPFAQAYASGTTAGAPLVRRSLGKGAIYTLGHALMAFQVQRCYVNCFDPGNDILGLFLRGALREACAGHSVIKHTVPSTQSSVLTVSHDVDAPDSHNSGQWGDAGALQMARVEQSQGVKGTYFVTTDYVAGYYNEHMVEGLCQLGMCPEGAHGVQHLYMAKLAQGDCSVTKAAYDPSKPTICGEVKVSMELLRQVLPADASLRAWRTPFLDVPPDLFEVLYGQGVIYDSSLGLGDLRTNLPVALARFPYQQDRFRKLPLFEFPINLEDGIGSYNEKGEEQRIELQRSNQPQFIALWTYAMLQNRANGGWNVLLVHPSYGRGVGPENLPIKMSSVEKMIELAKKHDVLVEPMTSLGDFWRGRDGVALDAGYDHDLGYSGTLQTGPLAAPRFSLEFGDHLKSFECPGAGPVTLEKNRVVFRNPLPASTTLHFTARVR